MATIDSDSAAAGAKQEQRLVVEGYPVEGVSIGGKETCVIFPTLRLALDIGLCPRRAVSQEFLFVSHGHLDHIGALHKYVAARGFLGLRPPTLLELYRDISQSELKHNLVPLDVGEEYELRKDLKVRAFRTYHAIPSQGYVICSVKQQLKEEFIGLPGSEIKQLKLSGVQITNTVSTPEIAFTGDTTSDFILDPDNADVLRAKVIVVESTFLDEHARQYGRTHLSEIARQSDKLENKAIVLIHFSARYTTEEIDAAINRLPESFQSKVYALKEGF